MIKFEWPDRMPPEVRDALNASWIAGGYDGTPLPVRKKIEPNRLTLTRDENDSGYFQLSWPTSAGSKLITTSTLRQRSEPYDLIVELTRGSLNRVRNLVAELAQAEIPLPQAVKEEYASLTRAFGNMIAHPEAEDRWQSGQQLIDRSLVLAERLVRVVADYRLEFRAELGGMPHTLWGSRLSQPLNETEAQVYLDTFNAVRIVPTWATLEPHETEFHWTELDALVNWASSSGLAVSLGPLIDLAGPFPQWLLEWAGDIPSLTAFMSDFISTLVARYREKVRVWQVFSGFNQTDAFGLTEDDRVRLAARLLDTAKECDYDAFWSIAIGQPWGDYLASDLHTYSPLVFVDTLLRAGYRIQRVDLEMLCGVAKGRASVCRDHLDHLQLIDLFDHLGVPLEVTLGQPLGEDLSAPILDLLSAVVGVPSVQGVYWDRWNEVDPCGRVERAALWRGQPERLRPLAEFRNRWLEPRVPPKQGRA